MTQLDLATLHEAIADALADEPCVVADRARTWRETTDRTRRLAAILRAHGLGRRATAPAAWETGQDHLGVLLHNGPEYLEAVLGAHKAAIAPFNINYRYTGAELRYLLHDARPAALVYGAAFAPVLAEALAELADRPLLLQFGGPLLPGALDYESALAAADPAAGVPDAGPDDAHLLYTGGTTGMPKGVIWRVGDLVAGPMGVRHRDGSPIDLEQAVARAVAIRGRVLPAPPLMHGAGTGIALGGWLSGATVVFPPHPERFDAATLLTTCAAERVTSMAIVGDAFGLPIADELEHRPVPLPDLRLLVNSGAALSDATKARLREQLPHLRISDVLGSSETGLHARRGEAGSNRFAGKGNAVVLDATRTRVLAPGDAEIGWLAQTGHIPRGYLGDPAKTAATFVTVDGVRYSVPGDRARLLADSTIEFLGREATTINTGGEKVFAEEVEQVVRSLPGVVDAIVVGRPSERWGQEVVALYQPVGEALAAEHLAAGCRERLAGYKVPKQFIPTERVRRHDNGKADYAWARAAASLD